MSHVVWLDGAFVAPDAVALPITDPGVRWGDGLFATMRARDRRVPLLDHHLARLGASVVALGLEQAPAGAEVREAVAAVLAHLDPGVHRIRVTVTERPTLMVEATPYQPDPRPGVTVASLTGMWFPGEELREHKSLSYAGHRLAHRRARAAGADHALLLDDAGRLGESDAATVFVVRAGTVLTPPVEGILGGVTRDVMLEAARAESVPVEVRHLPGADWRACDEMFLTNGLAGVTPVLAIDGLPVGGGVPGPLTVRLSTAFAEVSGWASEHPG